MQPQDFLIWAIAGSAVFGAVGLMLATSGLPTMPAWLKDLFAGGKEAAKSLWAEGSAWPADAGPTPEVHSYLAAIRTATANRATAEFLLECAAKKLSPAQAATAYIESLDCSGKPPVAEPAPQARRPAGGRK